MMNLHDLKFAVFFNINFRLRLSPSFFLKKIIKKAMKHVFIKILLFLINSINGNFSHFINQLFQRFSNFFLNCQAQQLSSSIPAYKLKNDLFTATGYDPWIRPVANTRTVTNISLSLSLMQIIKIVRRILLFFIKFLL